MGDMKKIACTLSLIISVLYGFSQATTINNVRRLIQGTWLGRGDSISELLITADSVTTFRFRANGISKCSYTLSYSPCDKAVKFPAATGIYIIEKYKSNILCCALASITNDSLKIIYPDGSEMLYINESSLLKKGQR